MPSEMMGPRGLSPSSFLSEELQYPEERNVAFWKTGTMPNYHGPKTAEAFRTTGAVSSPLGKHILLDPQMAKRFDPDLKQDHKMNLSLEKHAIGAERAVSRSLPRVLDYDLRERSIPNVESTSHLTGGEKIKAMGVQYENGLFSSSLSDLFNGKLRLSSNNSPFGHSVGAAAGSHYQEEEPFVSLEEMEAQTIGNLLPDDDELLSGVIDSLDHTAQCDLEDLDLFSSVGGMDLGEDSSSFGQKNSERLAGNSSSQIGGFSYSLGGAHPSGEQPSRTLFVRNINSNVEDSELRTLFEQYGEIRSLYTACKHRGFVMISYYDLRAARNAMKALQDKPLGRRKLDIHFSIPKENPSENDINQGTLAVFNLDSSISNDQLCQIFGGYGDVKEIHEASHENDKRFIEFYDVRAAEASLCELNYCNIAGKQIKVEPSLGVGERRLLRPFLPDLKKDGSGLYLYQNSPPSNLTAGESGPFLHGRMPSVNSFSPLLDNAFQQGISSSVPNTLPSVARMESLGNHSNVSESGYSLDQLKLELQGIANFHSHSLPESHDGLANGAPGTSPSNIAVNISSRLSEIIQDQQFRRVSSNGQSVELSDGVFSSSGSGSCPAPGQHFMWNNSQHVQPQGMMWPNSPSFVNGIGTGHPQRLHQVPRVPAHMLNGVLPINNHHVGSAPSINPAVWDRRHVYSGESPDASVFHPGSLESIRIPVNSPHPFDFVPHNVFPRVGGNFMDLPISSKNVGIHSHHQKGMMFPARGQMIPMMSPFDSPNERTRNRRNDASSCQGDNKKQFELDIDRIMRGEDKRTTLMIKNIPNKYTSKMLLAAIDERHRGTYDFIYLPIDFKNKCNVGYAFINMTDPSLIVSFYQTFNGKKWEKFNSEKVASLAYARIQGKPALIAHFQNSSLMNEDKRCRPILFHTDGPNAGDQVPFPMGVNVRPRPSKSRSATGEENNQESQPILVDGDEPSSADSSSCLVKDFN